MDRKKIKKTKAVGGKGAHASKAIAQASKTRYLVELTTEANKFGTFTGTRVFKTMLNGFLKKLSLSRAIPTDGS